MTAAVAMVDVCASQARVPLERPTKARPTTGIIGAPQPMTERTLRWDKFVEKVLPRVPVRRWGTGEDFAGIAVYLASDASQYHTGDTFIIDGGYAIF